LTEEKDNPGHSHSDYVPMILCAESRRHMETKIDNMEESIKAAIKGSFDTVKIVIAIVGFGMAILQLILHFFPII